MRWNLVTLCLLIFGALMPFTQWKLHENSMLKQVLMFYHPKPGAVL